jgi:hypothetical protein
MEGRRKTARRHPGWGIAPSSGWGIAHNPRPCVEFTNLNPFKKAPFSAISRAFPGFESVGMPSAITHSPTVQ